MADLRVQPKFWLRYSCPKEIWAEPPADPPDLIGETGLIGALFDSPFSGLIFLMLEGMRDRDYMCSMPDRGGYPDPQGECETGLTGDARPLKRMRDRAYGRPLPVRWGWIGPTFSGLTSFYFFIPVILMPMRRDPEVTSPAPNGYPQLAYGPHTPQLG